MKLKLIPLKQYILAVDEAAEIKEGELAVDVSEKYLGVILTASRYHAHHKKLIAHLPITEKISGLLELPDMDDVEKLAFEHSAYQADEYIKNHPCPKDYPAESFMNLIRLFKIQSYNDFKAGYKARGGYSESWILVIIMVVIGYTSIVVMDNMKGVIWLLLTIPSQLVISPAMISWHKYFTKLFEKR